MSVMRAIARPLLAAIFVSSGFEVAKRPESRVEAAGRVVTPLTDTLGLQISVRDAVRANGVAQVVGGVLFASGIAPRLSATVLTATVIPTTLAGHRFWEEEDPQTRRGQRIHFLKNAGLLGGLILAMVDTEGE